MIFNLFVEKSSFKMEQILHILKSLDNIFYLTGSRFFESSRVNPNSDWNFFTKCSILHLGFINKLNSNN